MALKDVEQFLLDYASSSTMQADWRTKPDSVLAAYAGLTKEERAMLKRGDTHEIKDQMKDAYGAALSVQFP